MVNDRVKYLQASAQSLKVSNNLTFESYIQLCNNLRRQAQGYQEVNDIDRAYLFTYRFINLVMISLPTHKDAKNPKFQDQVNQFKKLIKTKYMYDLEALQRRLEASSGRTGQLKRYDTPRPGTQQLAYSNLDQLNWHQLIEPEKIPRPKQPTPQEIEQYNAENKFQQQQQTPAINYDFIDTHQSQPQQQSQPQSQFQNLNLNDGITGNQVKQNNDSSFFDVSDLTSYDPESYRKQYQQQQQQQQQELQKQQKQLVSNQQACIYNQGYSGFENLPSLPNFDYKPYVHGQNIINEDLINKHQILPPSKDGQQSYYQNNRANYDQFFPQKEVKYPSLPKFEEIKKQAQDQKKQNQDQQTHVPPNLLLNGQQMEVKNIPITAVQDSTDQEPCCNNQNIQEVQNQVVKASNQSTTRAEYVAKQGELRYVYLSLGFAILVTMGKSLNSILVHKKFCTIHRVLTEFLRFAKTNTHKGIEFCGVLCGTLSKDDSSFNLSAIIIPKQKGTQNTVEMENEEELFEIYENHGYFPMGWIHTHPTQTCFLSSIDVHTQLSWQLLIDEAMAIVMAPQDTKQKCGIFRLTTPGGLDLVKDCQERGFHSHPTPKTGQDIYELCEHVYLSEKIQHKVHDLRDT